MENHKRNWRPCPNCRENLLKKTSRSIPFLQRGITIFLVQACVDCLSDPHKLDKERMVITLMEEGLPETEAQKASQAILEEASKDKISAEPISVQAVTVVAA
jgi:hypothetical protein